MSTHYSAEYYAAAGTLPMPVPQGGKASAQHYPYYSGDSTYSVSPPEGDSHASVSSGSGGAGTYSSVGYSASSYAGSSAGDYGDSHASASNVDLQEYMQERFATRINPLPLDHSVAKQAKT
jgi:hypothetical protein